MNTKDYITTAGYLILLRLFDLGLTFFYTPELRYEWNPIVSIFGYSWLGMLLTQILLIGIIIFVMSFYFSKKPLTNPPSDLSFNDYIYYYFYNKRRAKQRKWLDMNRRSPDRVLAYIGFLLMALSLSVSYFAVINNILVIKNVMFYSYFVYKYGHIFYPSLLAILTLFSFYLFFIIEYRGYKNKIVKISVKQ